MPRHRAYLHGQITRESAYLGVSRDEGDGRVNDEKLGMQCNILGYGVLPAHQTEKNWYVEPHVTSKSMLVMYTTRNEPCNITVKCW